MESKDNPADHASRGMKLNKGNWKLWTMGPEFLSKPECEWPQHALFRDGLDGLEIKKAVLVNVSLSIIEPFDKFIKHYSNWFKAAKAVAWLCRFKVYLRVMRGKHGSINVDPLQATEISNAEEDIVRFVQK